MVLLPAATKLGQGNKFTGVCLSTRGGGGYGGVSEIFFSQFIFPQKNFFWDAHPPPRPETVNARPVRILLECILVLQIFFRSIDVNLCI